MIAAQLCHLDQTAAKGLSLEFILHAYAKALSFVAVDNLASLSLSLDKLCIYCEALIQNSLEKDQGNLNDVPSLGNGGEELLDALDELRTTCCLAIRSLARGKKNLCKPSFEGLRTVFSLLAKHFLPQAHHSETAFFALLEVRNTLNAYLGPRTVEQLLEQFFPEGPQSLRQMLREGFARRGFYDFCEEREELFKGLKWGSLTSKSPYDR
jgi:hypothetical protein